MDRPLIQSGVRVARIGENDVPSLLLQRVARIRPHSELLASFLILLLAGANFSNYLRPIFTGISVPHFSPEQIKAFQFALPSVRNQEKIVARIKQEGAQLETGIDRTRREILLIREFHTRLIADVVTGKLDVREAASRLPEEVAESEPLDEINDLSQDDLAADEIEPEVAEEV
jgi:type I restriction enzyme S subunit